MLDVSYRQAKRLLCRYREAGPTGLAHRNAGRPSNRQISATTREHALALIRHKCSGEQDVRFGPTLAAEHLASDDGIAVTRETLRRWMLAEGLWTTHAFAVSATPRAEAALWRAARPMCFAAGLSATAFQWRSTPTGKRSMCDLRQKMSDSPASCR